MEFCHKYCLFAMCEVTEARANLVLNLYFRNKRYVFMLFKVGEEREEKDRRILSPRLLKLPLARYFVVFIWCLFSLTVPLALSIK